MALARYRYSVARDALAALLETLRVASGDKLGPSDSSFQLQVRLAAVEARRLADMLRAATLGNVADPPLVIPSPDDLPSSD